MRVIQTPRKTKRLSSNRTTTWLALTSVIIVFGISVIFVARRMMSTNSSANQVNAQSLQNNVTKKQNYTEQEFVNLVQNSPRPNTKPIINAPEFTTNEQANNRINQIIESRGFKLTSVPRVDISNGQEDSRVVLQPLAKQALDDLINEAIKNNIPLVTTKGEVTVEESKNTFADYIERRGISTQQIIDGSADNQIVELISEIDPPGYSWLHSGYGVVLGCGSGVQDFQTTTCYRWLSINNYANIKRFGWIPILIGNDQSLTKSRSNQLYWIGANKL